MSDGPWKALEMSRHNRKAARLAETDAASLSEIACELLTGRVEVLKQRAKPRTFARLRRELSSGGQRCLDLADQGKRDAIMACADGNPKASPLVSYAAMAYDGGLEGEDALREAVRWCQDELQTEFQQQFTEHYIRDPDGRTSVLKRIRAAGDLVDRNEVINAVLGIMPKIGAARPMKLDGIDDGPGLRP